MKGYVFIAIVVGVLLFCYWFRCIQDLMNRRDDEFAGRHDKILWVVLLIVLGVVGAVLYQLRDRVGGEEEERAAKRARAFAKPPTAPEWVECPECKKSIPASAEKCPCCGYRYFQEET